MDEMKAGIQCRGMDIRKGSRIASGAMDERRRKNALAEKSFERSEIRTRGHRTMRSGMSGCHPDATTKKIAGERETSEQNEEKTGRRCP